MNDAPGCQSLLCEEQQEEILKFTGLQVTFNGIAEKQIEIRKEKKRDSLV